MQEVMVKTHLIITDIHNEYCMNWCGKIFDTNPLLDENGIPTFAIIGSNRRMIINTIDINELEACAKSLTSPRGRTAVSTDTARIYIIEKDGNEKLLGVLTHKNIKSFAPMFDKVGYK